MSFVAPNPQASHGSVRSLGLAIANNLRARHPENTSGHLARALGCTKKAAENILAGHLSARTVTMIIQAFGPGFVAEAVMAAAGVTLETYIETQAAEAERAAARALESARGARSLHEKYQAAHRSDPRDAGPRP